MITIPGSLVTALFLVPADAERAIGALMDHGISTGRISVASGGKAWENDDTEEIVLDDATLQPEPPTSAEGFTLVQTDDPPTPGDMNAATEARRGGGSAASHPVSPIAAQGEHGLTTTTAADAAVGAARGSVVGIGIGLLAGAAALTVPGLGLVLAAGPLWTALAGLVGATAAGAAAGGVTGYLVDQGVPAETAGRHTEALTRGSVVVGVHLAENDDAAIIADILAKYGGHAV